MKLKILPIITVALLILTGFNTIASESENDKYLGMLSKETKFTFSEANIETDGEYASVNLEETDTHIFSTGKPMLPVVIKKSTFPHGTKINSVECILSGFTEEKLQNKITPAPKAYSKISTKKTIDIDEQQLMDANVYSSSEFYPNSQFDYKVTSGLDGVTVSIRMYPIRYNPAEDLIQKASNAEIQINYEIPLEMREYSQEFDMVIIAPSEFSELLQPLIDHKNDTGVATFLKTTEEIYGNYSGRDKPEQIKYFIKDAIETHNITYVLLVGGMKGIEREWYLPVRYTNMVDETDPSYFEYGYISDLYYADIYDGEGNFSSWDSNENDVFAEWTNIDYGDPEDIIDGDPDVSIGRLACRCPGEVTTVVNKIITYEKQQQDKFWSKKMVAVAGDSDPTIRGYEGELVADESTHLMKNKGYRIQKLYTSYLTFRSTFNVIRAIRFGAAFVHFEGHGNPSTWVNHPPRNEERSILGLNVFLMSLLLNRDRLPIVVVGGCHNSQFNVTPLNLIEGIQENASDYFSSDPVGPFWYQNWVRECWSWKLLSLKNGGAIATIGNTGLGYGAAGYLATEYYEGWIGIRFFELIANHGKTTVGLAHSQAISDFIQRFGNNDDALDRKTADQWVLLGDPSLKIIGLN